jgi:hypothetical protein
MSRVRSFGAFENPTTTLDATNEGRTDERTNERTHARLSRETSVRRRARVRAFARRRDAMDRSIDLSMHSRHIMSLPRVDDGWPPRAGARGRRDDDDGRERRLPVARSGRSYEPAYAFARDGFATMETGHPRDLGVVDAPPPTTTTTTTTTPATTTTMTTAWCAGARARDVGFARARRSDDGETAGEMETRRLAGFDRRLDRRASETRDARRSSAETPTVDAIREWVEMETTVGAPRGAEGVTGRLAALETSERATARELESVKAMLTDIMATQSNVLAALASHRSIDREEAVRGEAVERRRRGREKRRRERESERRDDARFGRDDDSAAIAIATDEDEGEMSESQLQKIVLRRMFMHQRGLNEESSQSA